jgi:hypothetical protein
MIFLHFLDCACPFISRSHHVVHHSSEYYNLFTALRQSVLQAYFSGIFAWPAALVVPPAVFMVHNYLNTLYQFWIHASQIPKPALYAVFQFALSSFFYLHSSTSESVPGLVHLAWTSHLLCPTRHYKLLEIIRLFISIFASIMCILNKGLYTLALSDWTDSPTSRLIDCFWGLLWIISAIVFTLSSGPQKPQEAHRASPSTVPMGEQTLPEEHVRVRQEVRGLLLPSLHQIASPSGRLRSKTKPLTFA